MQEPLFGLMTRYNWTDQFLGHRVWNHWPRPSATLRHALRDPIRYPKPYVYSTNRDGVRYPRELEVPKPPGVRRILVMGDSFTEGYYAEDTVAVRLEQRLQAKFPGRSFEVVNAGVSTYSPLLHYLRLKHHLIALQPDDVVVNIDPTDVFDDYWTYRPRTTFAPDGEPIAAGPPIDWRDRLLEWLKDQSYLMRVVARFRQGRRAVHAVPGRSHFAYHFELPPDSSEWQEEVGFCLGNIERLADYARSRGIRLTITMYPYRQHLEADPGQPRWHRAFETRVRELAARRGLPFFSAYDGIARAFREGRALYWGDDFHFTPVGQRIWADLIADYYIERLKATGEGTRDPGGPRRA